MAEEFYDRVRAREPKALGVFFDRHFDRVYGLTTRLLGDRAAAEDATQEVFLKVYRAAPSIDSTRDVRAWLTTITYNVCRDHWRSRAYRAARRSQPIEDRAEAGPPLVAREGDPEELLAVAERARRVEAAVAQLPQDMRAVVLLHAYEGMTHEEIAGVVAASPAAVRKRYSRALDILARSLGDLADE